MKQDQQKKITLAFKKKKKDWKIYRYGVEKIRNKDAKALFDSFI